MNQELAGKREGEEEREKEISQLAQVSELIDEPTTPTLVSDLLCL